MEEKRPFGEYIRKKRLEAGMTQRELAEKLFVTESAVSKWERNLSYPDVSVVTAICGALNISEHEFFTACDDDRARTQALWARRWQKLTLGLRWFFAGSYVVALLVCFICDLAIFHELDWFWIVLTSLALAFCFTNLPFLLRQNRVEVSLGAATGCLLLLLMSCWLYTGELWVIGGAVITAVCLALPWSWWAVWRFYGRHLPVMGAVLFSGWLFLLLTVIWAFAGGDWLLPVAFPLAATGLAFVWAGLAVVLWLPGGKLLKAGLLVLLLNFATPVFNCLSDLLLNHPRGVFFADYFNPFLVLERQGPEWINVLFFQLMLLASAALVIAGAAAELRRRRG